jgi:hypothetical protein
VGGIVVKEWQRLPAQLLHEYTQSTKRRAPKFAKLSRRAGDPPGFRYRVIIPDQKKPGTDKDLLFIPTQACKKESEARESVALLALVHLQPTMPHEKRLPEPYAATWLASVAALKEASKPSRGAAGTKAVKVAAGPPAAGAAAGAAAASSASKARPASSSAGKPAAASSAFAASWDSARGSAGGGGPSGGRTGAGAAVTLAGRHTSVAARNQHRLEKEKEMRGRQHQREARKALDPNKPKQVFMAEDMRLYARSQLDSMSRAMAASAAGGAVMSHEELEELLLAITSRLVSMGFSPERVGEGIEAEQAVLASADDGTRGDVDAAVTVVLDWLCLHVPETELPRVFNPRGRNLEVLRPETAGGPREDLLACGFHAADALSALSSCDGDEWAASAVLLAHAVSVAGEEDVSLGDGDAPVWPPRAPDWDESDETAAEMLADEKEGLSFVFEHAKWRNGVKLAVTSTASDASASASAAVSGRATVDVVSLPIGHGCVLRAAVITSPAAGSASHYCKVYPATAPLIMVRCAGASRSACEALPAERLAAAVSAAEAAVMSLGEPCLNAIIDAAESRLHELVSHRATPASASRKSKSKSRGRAATASAAAQAASARLARPLLRLTRPVAPPSSRSSSAAASGAGGSAPAARSESGAGGRRGGGRSSGGASGVGEVVSRLLW